jgi:hypothetical protein
VRPQAALDQDLDKLYPKIKSSSDAVNAEAKPKLQSVLLILVAFATFARTANGATKVAIAKAAMRL